MRSFCRARRRGDRGAAAVEFALMTPILMLLTFGLIQYGWFFYVSSAASHAASSVTRRLEVGDCWTGSEAADYVSGQLPTAATVTKTPGDLSAATPGSTQITVTVTADANLVGFLPMPNNGTVTRTVEAQLEDDQPGAGC